jgi:hypothetical protein
MDHMQEDGYSESDSEDDDYIDPREWWEAAIKQQQYDALTDCEKKAYMQCACGDDEWIPIWRNAAECNLCHRRECPGCAERHPDDTGWWYDEGWGGHVCKICIHRALEPVYSASTAFAG